MIISDTGIGSATIEVHPYVDKKITKLRLEIQTILNQIIQDEIAEAAKIDNKRYKGKSYLGKVGENLKAEVRGLGNIATGIDDSDSKEMLKNFASDYIDAQHSTELLEHAVEMVAGIGLTLL